MWTRYIAAVCLFLLAPSFLWAQELSPPISSVERIREIVRELQQIQAEKESYLQELENISEERKIETEERLEELRRKENELKELKTQLEQFGALIDDQATSIKKLSRSSTFWKIISGILATSLATTLIIWGASK